FLSPPPSLSYLTHILSNLTHILSYLTNLTHIIFYRTNLTHILSYQTIPPHIPFFLSLFLSLSPSLLSGAGLFNTQPAASIHLAGSHPSCTEYFPFISHYLSFFHSLPLSLSLSLPLFPFL